MQRCLVGCDNLAASAAGGYLLVHFLDHPDNNRGEALQSCRNTPDAPDPFYAGELVAMLAPGRRAPGGPQNQPWGNGTAVYAIDSTDDARDIIANPAFIEFRTGTTQDFRRGGGRGVGVRVQLPRRRRVAIGGEGGRLGNQRPRFRSRERGAKVGGGLRCGDRQARTGLGEGVVDHAAEMPSSRTRASNRGVGRPTRPNLIDTFYEPFELRLP